MIQITQGDYQIYVEGLPSSDISPEHTMVRFWTKWNGAKNPDELQRKFEAGFSVDELDAFIDALTKFRDAAVVRTAPHEAVQ
jgi:hypothetical protein